MQEVQLPENRPENLMVLHPISPGSRVEPERPSLPEPQNKRYPWKRLLIGSVFLALGGAAVVGGGTSIQYRLTHFVVDNGVINGRIVRLQTPIEGVVKALYARPGVLVQPGQVLARLERSAQEEQSLLQLTGEVQANQTQYTAANQSLELLNNQLKSLENQDQAVQTVDVALNTKTVDERQATLTAAIAKSKSLRSKLDSYQQLLAEGAVNRQKVDDLRFDWQAAEAEVKQAQATLEAAQTALTAAKQGVTNQTPDVNLLDQQTRLKQAIQTQTSLANTLKVQIENNQQKLQQAQAPYSDRQDLTVLAPLMGVVYSTEREQGEQMLRAQPLISLLDCNTLWVEAVVNTNEVANLDLTQPVTVQLAGYGQPIAGTVDLVQPLNSLPSAQAGSNLTQVQAIAPPISPNLLGQPLTRITIKIPPPPQYTQSQQFCGVGQMTRLSFKKHGIWGSS